MWEVALTAALIGGVVGVVSKIATNMITPGAKWNSGILGAFAGGAMYGAATVIAPMCPEFAAYAGAFAESLTNKAASYNKLLGKMNGEDTIRDVTAENVFNSATEVACETIVYGSLLTFTGGMASAVMPIKAPVGKVSLGALMDYGAKCFGQTAFQSSLMVGGSIFSNISAGVYNSEQKEAIPVMP